MDSQLRLAPAVLLAGAATLSVAGALWYWILMRGLWAAEALGPVCHHGAPLALHCPACYAAMAMVAGGFGLALITGGRESAGGPAT